MFLLLSDARETEKEEKYKCFLTGGLKAMNDKLEGYQIRDLLTGETRGYRPKFQEFAIKEVTQNKGLCFYYKEKLKSKFHERGFGQGYPKFILDQIKCGKKKAFAIQTNFEDFVRENASESTDLLSRYILHTFTEERCSINEVIQSGKIVNENFTASIAQATPSFVFREKTRQERNQYKKRL